MGLGSADLSLLALALDNFVEKTNKLIPGVAIKRKGSILPALFRNVSVSARILVLPTWEPF